MLRKWSIPAIAVVLAAVCCAALTGCQVKVLDTAADMKARLEKDIPAGTTLDTASSRLKALGFTVSTKTDALWAGRRRADYLYGDMREGMVVQRRWQVAVFDKHGVVTGTDAGMGFIGP